MSEMPLPRVRVLDSLVANQIAAGEVVERPASVLKELIENSLDAGATRLTVELEQGGVRLIRVRDDGVGIHPDDLDTALCRHGTSKLLRFEDLDELRTLGFRGEALPSIASVSRLTLTSRIASEVTGWALNLGGEGEAGTRVPSAMPMGTMVEVRDLFFNTPARRRFLRTERTELGQLESVLRTTALSGFGFGLTAKHGERNLLTVRPALNEEERLRRVGVVVGRQFVDAARIVSANTHEMRLWGWVVAADASGTTAHGQYFFLNRRAIRDPVIRHALGAAYEDMLPAGHVASYVLYLDMPAHHVDVNVHPAKSEVRFREARNVHDFVLSGIRRTLTGEADALHRLVETATEPTSHLISNSRAAPDDSFHPCHGRPTPGSGYPPAEPHRGGAVRDVVPLYGAGPRVTNAPARRSAVAGPRVMPARAVLVEQRFVVLEHGQQVVLLNVVSTLTHAARQVFSEAMAGAALTSRPLLIPALRSVTERQAQRVANAQSVLEQLGVVVRQAGAGRLSLRQLPRVLRRVNTDALLASLAAQGDVADSGALIHTLAQAAGEPGDRDEELRADVLEAFAGLTEGDGGPVAPWGRYLPCDILAQWMLTPA